MAVSLPLDGDGKLVQFDEAAIAALDLRRRGVKSEHDHIMTDHGPEGSGCTRRFSCAWSERFNAMLYMVGAVVSYNDPMSGVRKISRILPQTDPQFPKWVCTKCKIRPWRFESNVDLEGVVDPEDGDQIDAVNPGYKAGTHVPVFTRADLECTFELVPFDLKADEDLGGDGERERYTTKPGYPNADVSAEGSYIGLPGSVVQYATSDGTTATGPAGTPIPFPVGFVEMSGRLKFILRRWPFDTWGAGTAMFQRLIGTETTRGYIGALNKTEFEGYPPLSLQLIGIEQRLLPDPNGLSYSWDLVMVMQQKVAPYGFAGAYFHDTKATGAQSGYYQVLRPAAGKTTIAAGSLGDNDTLFHIREFADLWKPGV